MTPKFQWLKTTNHALKKINLFSYSSGSFNVQAVGESGVSVIYERVKRVLVKTLIKKMVMYLLSE